MLEIILLISVIFLILTFFYKQALCEFRINQIEWSQKFHIPKLIGEKLPLVVRSIPISSFWTQNDVLTRPVYNQIPVFNEITLDKWIENVKKESIICPWRYTQAERIAAVSGIAVWATKWINPSVLSYHRFWTFPRYHCWTGNMGLKKTVAWTCLFVPEGEVHVTIMPESMESFLPAQWLNQFPTDFTQKDTPFLADLKYIDIILRPGNALFMPPHWFMSYIGVNGIPMTCTISYHTPISYFAFQTSPYIQH